MPPLPKFRADASEFLPEKAEFCSCASLYIGQKEVACDTAEPPCTPCLRSPNLERMRRSSCQRKLNFAPHMPVTLKLSVLPELPALVDNAAGSPSSTSSKTQRFLGAEEYRSNPYRSR